MVFLRHFLVVYQTHTLPGIRAYSIHVNHITLNMNNWIVGMILTRNMIAQGYSARLRARWSGVRVPEGLGIFILTTASRPALGPTQLPIQWVPGALPLGIKLLGRQTDHSPPSSAEVKNSWSYISTPQYAFMVWCWVKKSRWATLPFPFPLP
jgi:hypothetical protein